MVREKSVNLRKKRESQGILTGCPNVKVLPLIMFKLMISLSAKMLYRYIYKSWKIL